MYHLCLQPLNVKHIKTKTPGKGFHCTVMIHMFVNTLSGMQRLQRNETNLVFGYNISSHYVNVATPAKMNVGVLVQVFAKQLPFKVAFFLVLKSVVAKI